MKSVWLFVVIMVVAVECTPLVRRIVPQSSYPDTACLDGSPVVYYVRTPIQSNTKWIIFMEGGGWCYNADYCVGRAQSNLGSSLWTPTNMNFGPGIMDDNPAGNPDFFGWNYLWIKYCDGASWLGNLTAPYVHQGHPLYFRGLPNLVSTFNHLQATETAFRDASELVITGCSAGSLGVLLHCDRMKALMPESTKVRCLADAGFFMDFTTAPLSLPNNQDRRVFAAEVASFSKLQTGGKFESLPPACLAMVRESAARQNHATPEDWYHWCIFPAMLMHFITTPVFLVQETYDDWQMAQIWFTGGFGDVTPPSPYTNCAFNLGNCQLSCASQTPCASANTCDPNCQIYHKLQRYQNLTASAIQRSVDPHPQHGYFVTSCWTHCQVITRWGPNRGPTISGKRMHEVFGDWYFDRPNVAKRFMMGAYPYVSPPSTC